jgi:vitamin B12 transporter
MSGQGTLQRCFLAIVLAISGLLQPNLFAQGIDSNHVGIIQDPDYQLPSVMMVEQARNFDVWQPSTLQINQTAASSPADFLQGHPSAYIRSYQAGGLATLSLRGTGASHTQVYWLGVPINSPTLGQSDLGLGMAATQGDPSLLLGGASLLLGSGGLGGALAWEPIRRKGLPMQLFLEGGSFGTGKLAFSALQYPIGKPERATASTAFAMLGSNNNFIFKNIALSGSPEQRLANAKVRQASFAQSFRLLLARPKLQTLEIDLYGQISHRQLPPTMLTTNNKETQDDGSLRARLGYSRRLLQGQLSVFGAVVADQMTYSNPVADLVSTGKFLRLDLEGKYISGRNGEFPLLREAGIRILRDGAFSENLPTGLKQELLSVYTQLEHHFLKNAATSLILREEYANGKFSWPLFSLTQEFRPAQTSTFTWFQPHIKISRNQHLPTLNDRYWMPGGNPLLRPEQAWSALLANGGKVMEIRRFRRGKRAAWQTFNITHQWGIHAQRVKDWILWMPGTSGYWTPENIGRVAVLGLEAGLGTQFRNRSNVLHCRLDYGYTRAMQMDATVAGDSAQGKQLIYTPMHQFKPGLEWEWKHWRIAANAIYASRRFTTRDNSSWLPAYATVDLLLGTMFAFQRLEINVEAVATNILNANYQAVAWRPMPGRGFSLRLNFAFQ